MNWDFLRNWVAIADRDFSAIAVRSGFVTSGLLNILINCSKSCLVTFSSKVIPIVDESILRRLMPDSKALLIITSDPSSMCTDKVSKNCLVFIGYPN